MFLILTLECLLHWHVLFFFPLFIPRTLFLKIFFFFYSLSLFLDHLSFRKTMVGLSFWEKKQTWMQLDHHHLLHHSFLLLFCIAIVSWDVLINFPHDQNIIAGAFKPPCKISISLTDGSTRKQVCCCVVLQFTDDIDVNERINLFPLCW